MPEYFRTLRWTVVLAFAGALGCGKQSSYRSGPWNQRTAQSAEERALVIKVRSAIRNDPVLGRQLPRIAVTEKNGSLLLMGVLPSQQEKDSVKNLASQIAGSDHVIDQLQVAKPLK